MGGDTYVHTNSPSQPRIKIYPNLADKQSINKSREREPRTESGPHYKLKVETINPCPGCVLLSYHRNQLNISSGTTQFSYDKFCEPICTLGNQLPLLYLPQSSILIRSQFISLDHVGQRTLLCHLLLVLAGWMTSRSLFKSEEELQDIPFSKVVVVRRAFTCDLAVIQFCI